MGTSQFKRGDAVTHLDQLVGEALVEDAIDSRPSWERNGVDFVPGALDQLLKINGQVLNGAERQQAQEEGHKKKT